MFVANLYDCVDADVELLSDRSQRPSAPQELDYRVDARPRDLPLALVERGNHVGCCFGALLGCVEPRDGCQGDVDGVLHSVGGGLWRTPAAGGRHKQ